MWKPMSWWKAGLLLVWMTVCFLGLTALNPSLRNQMTSVHSMFWTFIFPSSFVCMAVIALAALFISNNAERLRRMLTANKG
jgi:hypothetical protein